VESAGSGAPASSFDAPVASNGSSASLPVRGLSAAAIGRILRRLEARACAHSAALQAIAPIYLIAAAIVAGDAAGVCVGGAPLWLAGLFAAAAAILFMRRASQLGIAFALLALAAAASTAARAAVAPPPTRDGIRNFPDGAAVTLEGQIDRDPQRFPDREYVFVRVARAGTDAAAIRPATGVVRLTMVGSAPPVRVGDLVRAAGTLRFPRNFGDPGEFDYAGYLAREGIAATMVVNGGERGGREHLEVIGYRHAFPASIVAAIRSRLGGFIDAHLAGVQRAEMRALIIGDRGGIEPALRRRFALTGLAHVLVISGLHLGFVAAAGFVAVRLAMLLAPGLTALGYANKAAAVAGAFAASAYAAIAMPHVSTARALVMVLAYALAIVADRSRALLASLALAAIAICLAIPGSTADIGFQLSFVSVLAIVLGMRRFAPWWRRRFAVRDPAHSAPPFARRAAAAAAGYVAVSFWALLGVAPLTAYHFNQFSAVGVIANSIVAPLMAIGGVIAGLVACALGMAAPAWGAPLLGLAGWSLALGTSLAGWFARWPAAYFRIFTPSALEVALAYGLLLLWLTRPIERDRDPRKMPARAGAASAARPWRGCCLLLVLALAADAGWWAHDRWFHGAMRITFLSVGEGDAAVVRFANGRVMLIDAGGAWPGGFDFGERVVARYLWSRKIMRVDYLVVSHPDLDHFGGMAFIARNFAPREFWAPKAVKPEPTYAALLAEVAAERIPIRFVDSSMRPLRVGGASVLCLSPAPGEVERKDNNLSLVLRIGDGRRSALFTGDIEAPGERAMLEREPSSEFSATMLKAPHHGSRTSSSPALIAAVHPRVVVLSLGRRNIFGFPAPEVVDRYRTSGARVLRTDLDGAISVDFARAPPMVSAYNAD